PPRPSPSPSPTANPRPEGDPRLVGVWDQFYAYCFAIINECPGVRRLSFADREDCVQDVMTEIVRRFGAPRRDAAPPHLHPALRRAGEGGAPRAPRLVDPGRLAQQGRRPRPPPHPQARGLLRRRLRRRRPRRPPPGRRGPRPSRVHLARLGGAPLARP